MSDFELFSFDDKPARKAKPVAPIKKATPVPKAKAKAKAVKASPKPVIVVAPVAPVKKEKAIAVRKHVRQTKVQRVIKVLAGNVKVTFKRVKGDAVVASIRGTGTKIVVAPRLDANPERQFRAVVEYSTSNMAVYYGPTAREAYRRAASIAWH